MKINKEKKAALPGDARLEERLKNKQLQTSLAENMNLIKSEFKDVDVLKYRKLTTMMGDKPLNLCFIFMDGVVNSDIIDGFIIRPLMAAHHVTEDKDVIRYLMEQVIQVDGIKKAEDMLDIVKSVSYGESLLLVDGCSNSLLIDTKKFVTRSVAEPNGEMILSGPREGFTESLMQNLSMIRRRLRTSDLKLKFISLGEKSNTQLCVAYMDSIVDPDILKELCQRLKRIDIDCILDANYITELIRDNHWSLFRTTGYTERPDVVTAKLLEGRIAVFVDGTPVVLTVPYLFIENFQSNEDYYLSFHYTSFSRLLRITGFLLSIIVPALYVAVVSFHQEILPDPLMINIATDSHNVPLPAAIEAMLLLIMFDILRETGVRMPLGVGQALSIVGALVVGSAAVEADLVSAPMIIMTAISGITSLLVPKMNAPVVIVRLALLILASCFGLFGLLLGMAMLYMHILRLNTFGVPQLVRDQPFRYQHVKDSFFRAPWWQMLTRPASLTQNQVRQTRNGRNE